MDRVLCVILCIVVIVVSVCILRYCSTTQESEAAAPTSEPTVEETTQETTDPTNTEVTEVTTAPTEPMETEPLITEPPETEPIVTEPVETEPPVALYNVPLSEELQLHIIDEAEKHCIDPAIIFAMAYRESSYRPHLMGDGGDSYGLLQVQLKWHSKRMEKLNCTDLLDPFQNVTVAVDYLAELLGRYGSDIAKALTAYNRGSYAGTITRYAKNVLATAEQINSERRPS